MDYHKICNLFQTFICFVEIKIFHTHNSHLSSAKQLKLFYNYLTYCKLLIQNNLHNNSEIQKNKRISQTKYYFTFAT